MSLIEQAAKRLEELRRAEVPMVDAPGAPAPEAAAAPLSTPESVVRALEAQRARPTANDASVQAAPRPTAEAAAATKPARQSRFAQIDLARLKQLGFITPDEPRSQTAEEFRVIKRPIIDNAVARDGAAVRRGNLVMVTSAVPGEGKTFTATNLAMSIAMEYDSTVLLVDGDVARPSLPSLLGIPKSPGLLDVLTHPDVDVADALVKTNVDRLTVLPGGSQHRRATELLASDQMAKLLADLSSRYADRIVIFDSPPLLSTTEARELAGHMGQIIMVVAAESTTQGTLEHALAAVEDCPVVLTVLNKASRPRHGDYYGYYGVGG